MCCDTRGRPNIPTSDMIGSYLYYKPERAGWQLAQVTQQVVERKNDEDVSHTIKLLDLGRQMNVKLNEEDCVDDGRIDSRLWNVVLARARGCEGHLHLPISWIKTTNWIKRNSGSSFFPVPMGPWDFVGDRAIQLMCKVISVDATL